MSRAKRFDTIKKLRDRTEQSAVQYLGSAKRKLTESELFLEQLLHYQRNYQAQFNELLEKENNSMIIVNYHHFMKQLEIVIKKQQEKIQQDSHHVNQQNSHWLKANKEKETIGWLIDNIHMEEFQQENKREQREMDELAWRKRED